MVATNFTDISKRNYKTIGEIRRALIDLGDDGRISGNLRNILVDISQRTGNDDLVGWINDDKIENLLEALSGYDESLKIENIHVSETKAEGSLDEARIEALVAEYEEYLEKHNGNREKAFGELEKNRGRDLVGQFRTNLEEHYRRNLKNLEALKVKDPEKLAEIIAEKEMVGQVKDLEAFEKTVNEAIVRNRPDLDEVARLSNEKAGADGITAARLVAEIKVDQAVMEMAESMVSQMEGNNVDTNNRALAKVSIEIFDNTEKRQKLVEIVKEVLKESLVDGEIDEARITKVVEDRAGIKLNGFGEEVTRVENGLNKLKEENPISVTIYTDEELTKEVFEQTWKLNPDKPEEALEFAKIVARANSPSESPFNRLDNEPSIKEVEEMLVEAKLSKALAAENSPALSVMTFAARQTPEQWQQIVDNYEKLDGLNKPLSSNPQVRALNGLMKLSKDNPSLAAMMQKTQSLWGKAEKVDGVLTKVVPGKWAGFKQFFRLDSRLTAIKGVGTVGKAFGQIQGSVAGKALFQLATDGLTINTAKSFFLGTSMGASFKLGLQALGKKLATTAIGKGLVALGANVIPILGQIGSALMIGSIALDLIKKPLDKVRGFLGKLGLDFLGDAKKILQDLGIGGLPGTFLGGVLTIGAAIVLLPTLLLGIGLPWTVMAGVFGGINMYSIMQHGMYSTFAPPILVQPGPRGLDGGDLGPYPTIDPNITITPGCPSKTEWPLKIGIVVTQGPGGKYSHYHPGHTQAVDFSAPGGTPIYATHNGVAVVNKIYSNVWGWYVDILGECNGVRYTTRYAHMPTGGRIVSTGETIQQGQAIGVVGNTGKSTGNHLHYQLIGTGIMERINNWLPRPVQEGV